MGREKQEIQKIVKETATQKFHREMKELKLLLPANWRITFFQMYPAYDTYRGGLELNNVFNGNSTNETILEGLKEIIKKEIKDIIKETKK